MPDSDSVTSLTLLGRLRADDADAWSRLLRLYGPLVTYWVGRAGVTGADAEDLVQDVFREVVGGLASFRRDRPGDTFRGWLRGVTRIALLRHGRRAGRQVHAAGGTHALERINALPDQVPDEDDPPAEQHALYRRALELVRGEFEDKTWKAFWATTVEGQSATEAAALLGLSSAAVRQAKSRVLRRLKEEVGELVE
jgi:RNA polymerase sigma-70 factor (ECF subfamily)